MRSFISMVVLLVFSACALPGVEAETPNEKLVVLEYSYQAALRTVDGLVMSGTLKGSSARKAIFLINQAGEAVRSARSALKSGGSTATQNIRLASSLVIQLVTFLESQKKGVQTSWAISPLLYRPYHPSLTRLGWQAKLSYASSQFSTMPTPKGVMLLTKNLAASLRKRTLLRHQCSTS